ncbi:HVA22-like protein h [Drosophila busckii]|uniref:HVA22-like protein h n=1 Tax=Drosophila busckii TaxID=30019 RepID=UPI00083F2492|nr:HVA22-like protein h [Drosophila busckii]
MNIFGMVTRILTIVFGTLLPARKTYKALGESELNAWGKYWVVYGLLVFLEVLADAFFSWMPLYNESKLLLVIWMVVSAPRASVWMFDSIFNPLLAPQMPRIDEFLHRGRHNLLLDALNYSSLFCLRMRDIILPWLSDFWHKSLKPQPSALKKRQTITIEEQVIEPSSSVLIDPKPQEQLYVHELTEVRQQQKHSRSQTQMLEHKAKKSSQHSLPELAKKLTSTVPNLARSARRKYNYNPAVEDDESLLHDKEETFMNVEDFLAKSKNEYLMGELQQQQRQLGSARKDHYRRQPI